MWGMWGLLLIVLSCFVGVTLQQCASNQTYTIVPAYNNKLNTYTNKIRLGVMMGANSSQTFGGANSFPSSVMRFAAERFNNRSDILPDTMIELAFLPTPAGSALSSNLLTTLFGIQTLQVNALIGGLSTTESRVIQLAAKLYNVSQVSSYAVGSVLANRDEYPYYLCTEPFDTIQISAIVAQFQFFNWTRGLILYSDNDYGAGYTSLVLQGSNVGVNFIPFSIPSAATSTNDIASQMNLVKEQMLNNNYRIVVLYLTAQSTAFVMKVANDLGLVGDKFVYILSTNAAGVYTQTTIQPDPKPYLKGSLAVLLPSPSGPFYDQELAAYKVVQAANPAQYAYPLSYLQFFWITYDSVMTYAYAYDNLLKSGVAFSDIKGDVLFNALNKVTYTGVSGKMIFTGKGDRLGFYSVQNYYNGTQREVAQYSAISNNISVSENAKFQFYDGSSTVPSDGSNNTYVTPDGYTCKVVNGQYICEQNYAPHKFSSGLSGGLGAVVGVGVLIAFFAITMLVMHWNAFVTKYGTFYCAVIISGVLLSYISAISLLPVRTDELCLVFPWLLGIGFTLVYGCLFIKAWILYRLWRHALQLKKMAITFLTVIKWVGFALTIEIVFMIIWTVVDPPKVHLVKMFDHTIQPQCKSNTDVFWIIFLCIKGAWVLFGVVISVLTRGIVKEYNSFTEFAYAMYNILVMMIVAVPLGVLLQEVPDGVMIVSVIIIVAAFTFTPVILFFNMWHALLFPSEILPTLGKKHSQSSLTPSHKSSTASSDTHSGSSK